MIKFSASIEGMDSVSIVIDANDVSKKVLLNHLALGSRRSEKFLIDNIDQYFSIIKNNKEFVGSDKKNRGFKVKFSKI